MVTAPLRSTAQVVSAELVTWSTLVQSVRDTTTSAASSAPDTSVLVWGWCHMRKLWSAGGNCWRVVGEQTV